MQQPEGDLETCGLPDVCELLLSAFLSTSQVSRDLWKLEINNIWRVTDSVDRVNYRKLLFYKNAIKNCS